MKEKDRDGAVRRTVRDKIRHGLELDDVLCASDMLEVRGRETLTVRGCRKILLYTAREIRLRLCEYVLVIKGEGLYCASYYAGAVRVDGEISSLEFETKEESEK